MTTTTETNRFPRDLLESLMLWGYVPNVDVIDWCYDLELLEAKPIDEPVVDKYNKVLRDYKYFRLKFKDNKTNDIWETSWIPLPVKKRPERMREYDGFYVGVYKVNQ